MPTHISIADYGVAGLQHRVSLSGQVDIHPDVDVGPNPIVSHIEPVNSPRWRLHILADGSAEFLVPAPPGFNGPFALRVDGLNWARLELVAVWNAQTSAHQDVPVPEMVATSPPRLRFPASAPGAAQSIWERLNDQG